MSKRELEVLAAAPPPPAPEPVSVPQVETEPALPPRTGTWNLTELQAAVDAYADPTPEQAENWRTYLYFVREHASPDGTLPRSLDPLIADVFAEIVHRRAPVLRRAIHRVSARWRFSRPDLHPHRDRA